MKKLNKEELEGIAKAQARKIKGLEVRIEDWIHELAYYTEEKVATPKGVKKFIGKALDDKVKEIKELREENKELKIMLVDLQEAYNEPKTQPNALKASEVKPKPLSKSRIEEILHNEIWTTFEQESRPYGMRAVSIKKAAEAIVTHIAEQERE